MYDYQQLNFWFFMQKRYSLPAYARLSINRCNLPASILGGLTFQQHPTVLLLDGVAELHRDLFRRLDNTEMAEHRAQLFCDYMTVHFQLNAVEKIGFNSSQRINRSKADYRSLLRGWFFSPNSKDAAVIKAWVESRFGLITRFHKQLLRSPDSDAYRNYMGDYCVGIYNTNSLESQLDMVYSYCQYEIFRRGENSHVVLYRGLNNIQDVDRLGNNNGQVVLLLNNINSFSLTSERASEFGDYILQTIVPKSKIFYASGILPIHTAGEDEVVVLGGVYSVTLSA